MKLSINGKEHQLDNVRTIADVLKSIGTEGHFFAVARNMECIPRSQYAETTINENDEIEILTPMQGG